MLPGPVLSSLSREALEAEDALRRFLPSPSSSPFAQTAQKAQIEVGWQQWKATSPHYRELASSR